MIWRSQIKKVLSERMKVAVWQKIYTYCLQKKEALPFQPMVKVLKIKTDLWRNKKITLLNIKPYNLCKNSMWPTKAYIYLYIVHLKRIYNSYSQTKEKKKKKRRRRSSKQDIMSNTAVPSLWVNDASALSSEENQEEGLLLEICTPTLKSHAHFFLKVYANTDINFISGDQFYFFTCNTVNRC